MPRCDQCRFFHPYPPAAKPNVVVVSVDGIRGGGECRVNPPRRVKNETFAMFPLVRCGTWCGCFESRAIGTSLER